MCTLFNQYINSKCANVHVVTKGHIISITFKIKTGYYLELLTPGTMKLLGSTKVDINKDKNVPRLEITEVVLINCNIVNSNYQQDSRILYTIVPNKSFG